MRKTVVVGLVLLALLGCKRATNQQAKEPPPPPEASKQPSVHGPTGIVVNPGAGGSGGAVQAVRTAVVRKVNEHELGQLRLFIDTASTVSPSGQLPPPAEITAAMQREAPAIYKMLQDRVLVLTGARSRNTIWAYTGEPQSVAGEHLVVDANGIRRMPAAALQQQLAAQRGQ